MNNKLYNKLEIKIEADGKSSGTLREYFASIKKLEKYYEGRDLKKLTNDELYEYAQYVKNNFSKSTYNSRIAAVRYLYTKVLSRKIDLKKLPFQRIKDE